MLKLKNITIENFRGLKLPLELDFHKGGKANSILIYGRNGTGKSSIVDAWEWLTTFRIKDLEKEGVSNSDYPHKLCGGKNCFVKAEFIHTTINYASATFNNSKITTPTVQGDYEDFVAHAIYPNYLRYSDLQEFVYLSKTDKYKFIAKFFGLDKFTKNQTDIGTAINKLTQHLQGYNTSLSDTESQIRTLTSVSEITEASIVAYINIIALKQGLPAITQFKDTRSVWKMLHERVESNPITKAAVEWNAFKERLNNFYPLSSILTPCKELEILYEALKKNEQAIKDLILTDLYERSLEILPQMNDSTRCPLCDLVYPGDLKKHITEKHTSLADLHKEKQKFDQQKALVESELEFILKKITAVSAETSEMVLKDRSQFFKDISTIKTALPSLIAIVKSPLKDIATLNLSFDPTILLIETISLNEKIIQDYVDETIKALTADPNSKSLALDFSCIHQLATLYPKHLKNERKVNYLINIRSNLEILYNQLTNYIQKEIQSTFISIQSDLVDYYEILEENNTFLKNPAIKLVTGKDKAVELEIEFITEKTTPAFKFMSESQVNSFGLAIFLSSVKHFNSNFKFIIFDDVVSSFDSFKRPKVAKLISTKFNDFQILMLTHDNIFFDTMQKFFPAWQRYKFVSWDYTTGPKCKISKNYAEDIQALIDEDDAVKAGQTLGRYLEWTLGSLNECLQTPIRYKIENSYTLAEFFDPFVARLKDKLKAPNRTHNIVLAFDDFETIFRNYCMHWKDAEFSSIEIKSIFDKWRAIELMLFCHNCTGYVEFDGVGPYIKCPCGKLDLKDSGLYS